MADLRRNFQTSGFVDDTSHWSKVLQLFFSSENEMQKLEQKTHNFVSTMLSTLLKPFCTNMFRYLVFTDPGRIHVTLVLSRRILISALEAARPFGHHALGVHTQLFRSPVEHFKK